MYSAGCNNNYSGGKKSRTRRTRRTRKSRKVSANVMGVGGGYFNFMKYFGRNKSNKKPKSKKV